MADEKSVEKKSAGGLVSAETAMKMVQGIQTTLSVSKTVFHYGFIPLIIGLGLYNTPAPQRPAIHSVFLPW